MLRTSVRSLPSCLKKTEMTDLPFSFGSQRFAPEEENRYSRKFFTSSGDAALFRSTDLSHLLQFRSFRLAESGEDDLDHQGMQ